MTIITDKMRLARLEIGKGYTSKRLIELLGENQFKNLLDGNKLKWIKDNSFGDKLYAREVIK